MMDPALLIALLGPEGMSALMGSASAAPAMAAPPPVIPALPPPALAGDSFGPPAPMPAPQSFEPTNTMGPRIAAPNEPYRSEMMPQPASLGAALEPQVPMPRPRPEMAPGAAPAAGGGDALLKTLQGVKAPAAPTPQRVATPNAPVLRPIQSGGFMDLLASLGIGPQQALPGLKLPSTLGQALGGR